MGKRFAPSRPLLKASDAAPALTQRLAVVATKYLHSPSLQARAVKIALEFHTWQKNKQRALEPHAIRKRLKIGIAKSAQFRDWLKTADLNTCLAIGGFDFSLSAQRKLPDHSSRRRALEAYETTARDTEMLHERLLAAEQRQPRGRSGKPIDQNLLFLTECLAQIWVADGKRWRVTNKEPVVQYVRDIAQVADPLIADKTVRTAIRIVTRERRSKTATTAGVPDTKPPE